MSNEGFWKTLFDFDAPFRMQNKREMDEMELKHKTKLEMFKIACENGIVSKGDLKEFMQL